MGYPGGIFDPLGFSKGNLKELQTKEIKNGRLAMIAFMAFVIQVCVECLANARARARSCGARGPCGRAGHAARRVFAALSGCCALQGRIAAAC